MYIYVLHDATRAFGATFRLFQGLLRVKEGAFGAPTGATKLLLLVKRRRGEVIGNADDEIVVRRRRRLVVRTVFVGKVNLVER